MGELITTFHIDWKLIIAQMVNFGIVFLVLYRFALKPLSRTMERRQQKIRESLAKAEEAEQKLVSTEQRASEELNRVRAEANRIIAEAQEKANQIVEMAQLRAKEEAEEVKKRERARLEREIEELERKLRERASSLITKAVERILMEDLDPEQDERYRKRIMERVEDLTLS